MTKTPVTKTLAPGAARQDKTRQDLGALAPLRDATYRRVWCSSVLSNFGQLILGVGAAWEMTRITHSAAMVAMVQTAMMVPNMLVVVPAGAMADMFDRRKVAMTGLGFASCCAALLTVLASLGYTSPALLLGFCLLISGGVALYGPAWQAMVRELVPPEQIPAAVTLGSVSYNIARCVGPALGGIIVVALGARAAFATNALCYLPLLAIFIFWRRPAAPARLPPERIDRAIVSGARYVIHSPAIRIVLLRSFICGITGASTSALMPLVARDLLHGDARIYGLLLGAFGIGAVAGALLSSRLRARLNAEHMVRLCAVTTGAMMAAFGLSHSLLTALPALSVAGASWMLMASQLNVAVQLAAPRWVTARALAWYQSALTGGLAAGAWLWGHSALHLGVGGALIASGTAMGLGNLLAGWFAPMPDPSRTESEMVEIANEPEVALALTFRSGPIAIEIDYDVEPERARQFYDAMLKLQHARLRNGAFDWSLERDIANPAHWTERYHCPTWGDYLRLRSRFTLSDRALQEVAQEFHRPSDAPRVRRRLQRPFGSVRWSAETPDPQQDAISVYTP